MRIFVYEHLTARAIGRDPDSPEHAMYREGLAMWRAIRADLARVAGVELVEDPSMAEVVILIAPETGGILAELSELWDQRGVWRLGPTIETIRRTTDKLALADHWRLRGVPTPTSRLGYPQPDDPYPIVWKPRDGCGSQATFLLRSWTEAESITATTDETTGLEMLVQPYVSGQAASIAFLCGPAGAVPLLPTYQHLSNDGRFRYTGGSLPLPPALARRALTLGERALAGLSGLLGYVGVDLVLGAVEDGSEDYAIEVNPRFTTSYVGLRAACADNLAAILLETARGRPPEKLHWLPGSVSFQADGTWQRSSAGL